MANVVTTTLPLDNNNEISSSSSANEQVINSPPHLNRLAGGNDINNGNSTEESSSEVEQLRGQNAEMRRKTQVEIESLHEQLRVRKEKQYHLLETDLFQNFQ